MLRYKKHLLEVHCNENIYINHSQSDFLYNPKNKKALITLLSSHIVSNGYGINKATYEYGDILDFGKNFSKEFGSLFVFNYHISV